MAIAPRSPRSTRQRSDELVIELPEPHRGQQIVRRQAKRFNWLCAGRRWRKTTLAMAVLVEASLTGGEYLCGAPTYKQARVLWNETRRAVHGVYEFNEGRMTATSPTGGVLQFVSLDNPDNARGMTADGMVIDEASEVSERAWSEILRPMLLDTGGWAWFTYTPKGRNWTYAGWMQAQDRPDDSMAWQIPSLGCAIVDGRLVRMPHRLENPDLKFGELQQTFETVPERTFRQEILAEFLEDAGGVFRGVRDNIRGQLETEPRHPTARYVIGVDLAKYNDFTVCAVGDLQLRRLVAFDRWNRSDWPMTCQRIYDLAKRWNNAVVWLDATGVGDPPVDFLERAGVRVEPYKISAATKKQLIENAQLMVEQHSVSYPDIPVMINELTSYAYDRTASGLLSMNAPEGQHDDCVIAFALMCWPMGHVSTTPFSLNVNEQLRAPVNERIIGGVKILNKRF